MQTIAKTIASYNRKCIGCQNAKRDIMVSVQGEDASHIDDIFLTQEQAKSLLSDLQSSIEQNEPE